MFSEWFREIRVNAFMLRHFISFLKLYLFCSSNLM